jgi:hypothetical protein
MESESRRAGEPLSDAKIFEGKPEPHSPPNLLTYSQPLSPGGLIDDVAED